MLRWWTVQIDADGPNPSFPSGMIFPLLYLPVPCRYSKENHPAFLTAGQVPPCNSDFNMIPCINHSWEGVLRESFVRWHGDKIWPANPLWYVCCTQLYLCIYDIYNFNTHISIYIYTSEKNMDLRFCLAASKHVTSGQESSSRPCIGHWKKKDSHWTSECNSKLDPIHVLTYKYDWLAKALVWRAEENVWLAHRGHHPNVLDSDKHSKS